MSDKNLEGLFECMLCYAKLYSMNHKFTSEGARKRKLVLHIEEIYLKFCADSTIDDLIVSIIKSAVIKCMF